MHLLPHLPFWAELLVFLASAVTIWIAGIFLSNNTDVLADRLHLGQALGGLILLAVAPTCPRSPSPTARPPAATSTSRSAIFSAASRSRPWFSSHWTRSAFANVAR
jgi:hypothetical protein